MGQVEHSKFEDVETVEMEIMFPSFIAIALSLLVSVCNGQINIQTSSGNVKGKIVTVEGIKYATFQGIPYVKAPTGNLRFQVCFVEAAAQRNVLITVCSFQPPQGVPGV